MLYLYLMWTRVLTDLSVQEHGFLLMKSVDQLGRRSDRNSMYLLK